MKNNLRIAYVIDPRLPGGTSSAVAQELRVTARLGRVSVHAVASAMFRGTDIAPPLKQALLDLGLELIWDAPVIGADLVLFHNPSFLKFQKSFEKRIVCNDLIVVTHENFLRPGHVEPYDVGKCLELIDRAALALRKAVAPISSYNRATVSAWFDSHGRGPWTMLEADWFNICALPMMGPNPSPRDRRGRHSRPGFEKFPSLAAMDLCFPDHATNTILGADTFIAEGLHRPHWAMLPFRGIELDDYFAMIDFMVYFTAPTWRESFGRVLAEAIAAGKVVISDAGTAAAFDGAVIAATPPEVDAVIGKFISDPKRYANQVVKAQARLAAFSADAFAAMLTTTLRQPRKVPV